LLRIHLRGFEVVDTEKIVVELAYIFVDEVAAGYVDATATVAVRVVESIDIVPLRWNRPLGCLWFDNKLPEIFGRRDIAGEAGSCDVVRRSFFNYSG
jgi:hypothetical protein